MSFLILKVNPEIAEERDYRIVSKDTQNVTERHRFSFRLYDGDMTLCFEGVSTRNDCFDPLDDFGASYGCVEIHYKHGGKFEQL